MGSPAERAVIGALLLDSRAFQFVDGEIVGDDFSVMQLGQVFDGISRMMAKKEPVDVITVGSRLGEWSVRGLTEIDLHKIVEETPGIAAAGPYALRVREDSVRRSLRMTAQRILQRADSSDLSAGDVVQRTVEELKAIAGRSSDDLVAKPLGEILALADSYDWVIPGLLERRDRLVLTGGEGAGKSTFVRQLAITAASGLHPFTEAKVDPVRVLVVDAENTEVQWKRSVKSVVENALRYKPAADPRTNVFLACAPRLDLTKDAHLGQVHRLIDAFDPGIVFIGPLYRLIPRAITNDDEAAPLLSALDTIRDRGVAMVMEAHAGHARDMSGERNLRPRGSAALMGWPEFGMGIRSDPDYPGANKYELVRWRGDRDSRKWPETLRRGLAERAEFPWVSTEENYQ